MLHRCLLTKRLPRSSDGSLLRVRTLLVGEEEEEEEGGGKLIIFARALV